MLTLKMLSAACGTMIVAISYQIGREVVGRQDDPALGRKVGLYPLLGGTRLPAIDQAGNSLGDSVIIYEFSNS
jgi:hypothetical protein